MAEHGTASDWVMKGSDEDKTRTEWIQMDLDGVDQTGIGWIQMDSNGHRVNINGSKWTP